MSQGLWITVFISEIHDYLFLAINLVESAHYKRKSSDSGVRKSLRKGSHPSNTKTAAGTSIRWNGCTTTQSKASPETRLRLPFAAVAAAVAAGRMQQKHTAHSWLHAIGITASSAWKEIGADAGKESNYPGPPPSTWTKSAHARSLGTYAVSVPSGHCLFPSAESLTNNNCRYAYAISLALW